MNQPVLRDWPLMARVICIWWHFSSTWILDNFHKWILWCNAYWSCFPQKYWCIPWDVSFAVLLSISRCIPLPLTQYTLSVLFCFCFSSWSTIFQSFWLPGFNQYYVIGMKCLAKGHNTTPQVRIEPTILQSVVRRSPNWAMGALQYALLSEIMFSPFTQHIQRASWVKEGEQDQPSKNIYYY